MTPTVLVTGASGGLGRRVVEGLRGDGWRVRALVHRTEIPQADESVHGSLLDDFACAEAVDGCAAVVHAAAVTHARSARSYREVNVDGTGTLVHAATAAAVDRFLMLSSRTAVPTAGWYGESKLAAERVVSMSPLSWTILRLPEVYGAGSDEGVDELIRRVRTGRTVVIPGKGESRLCPLHADDAAVACVNAIRAEVAVGQTYVLGGACVTFRELAERCIAIAGSPSRIVTVPWVAAGIAAFASRVLPLPVFPDQIARLRVEKPGLSPTALADLDVAPRALEDGLRALLHT